jgi:PAS domain S-box-containing protein
MSVFNRAEVDTVQRFKLGGHGRKYSLKEQLADLTGALASIGDGLIITDSEGKISFINEAALRITGHSHAECIGQMADAIFQIINLRTKASVDSPISKVLQGISPIGLPKDSAIVTKEGVELYVSANISSIVRQGKVSGAVAVFRDIDRLRSAEEELLTAKEAAEIASQAKGQFLANMSHEIRTPLNGMLGMIDLTMNTKLNAEQTENIAIAKGCAETLLNVINDILDFSKIEAGKLVIASRPFNIAQVVAKTVRLHTVKAEEKGLKIVCNIPADLPQMVEGDAGRLEQVLHNLLSNAIKFTTEGEIALSMYKVTPSQGGLEFCFAISDTGIGIAAEDQQCLFKSFSQVDGSLTRKYGGSGLGLAISKQLVELMGGRIWLESQQGQGSIFYFTVRLKLGGAALCQTAQLMEERSLARPVTILLVEDDKINQKVIKLMLEQKGYSVEAVENGREALVRLTEKNFDVVLMDIQMPELDGVEATRRIRQLEKGSTRHQPIIAVTAYALAGDRERFLQAGMDDYLAKPLKMQELYVVIDKVLERAHAAKMLQGLAAEAGLPGRPLTEMESKFVLENMFLNCARLQEAYTEDDFLLSEQTAHNIKMAAADLDEQSIKTLAFRIELAARKSSKEQITELFRLLSLEVDFLKKKGIL